MVGLSDAGLSKFYSILMYLVRFAYLQIVPD